MHVCISIAYVLAIDFLQVSISSFWLAVWKELEKENREFFETYKKDRGEDSTRENPPPDGGGSASSKSSADDDDQTADQ